MNPESHVKVELAELLEVLDEQPMRALRRCKRRFEASEKAHRENVNETIAFIVAFVLHLRESEADLEEFLRDEFWEGKPHGPNAKNLSRLATMYILGARESRGALYQQGLEYTNVVKYFLSEKTRPRDVPAVLRQTPIYKILGIAAGRRAEDGAEGSAENGRAIARDTAPDQRIRHLEDETLDRSETGMDFSDDEEGTNHDEAGETPTVIKPGRSVKRRSDGSSSVGQGSSGGNAGSSRRYPFKMSTEVAVEAAHFLPDFFKMHPGDAVAVVIRRNENEGKWAKFEVVDLHCASSA